MPHSFIAFSPDVVFRKISNIHCSLHKIQLEAPILMIGANQKISIYVFHVSAEIPSNYWVLVAINN